MTYLPVTSYLFNIFIALQSLPQEFPDLMLGDVGTTQDRDLQDHINAMNSFLALSTLPPIHED